MSRILIAGLLFFFSIQAAAQSKTDYIVEGDEFGSGKSHRIQIATADTSFAALTLACYSGGRLQGQIFTKDTIFPNNTKGGYMWLNVTFKSDASESPVNSVWRMNMMKYKNAWLIDGVEKLVSQMSEGNVLSMRLDKSGTIYRFPITEAQSHLGKVISACEK